MGDEDLSRQQTISNLKTGITYNQEVLSRHIQIYLNRMFNSTVFRNNLEMESQSFHMSLPDCKSVTVVYRANMSKQDLEKLVHVLITIRFDYCNGLFTGFREKALSCYSLFRMPRLEFEQRPTHFNTSYKSSNPCVGSVYVRGSISQHCCSPRNYSTVQGQGTFESKPNIEEQHSERNS